MLEYIRTKKALAAVMLAIIALLAAFVSVSKKESLILGGIVGFAASYSYLWFDNSSKLSFAKVAVLVPLVVLPAIFGLVWATLCVVRLGLACPYTTINFHKHGV